MEPKRPLRLPCHGDCSSLPNLFHSRWGILSASGLNSLIGIVTAQRHAGHSKRSESMSDNSMKVRFWQVIVSSRRVSSGI
jgi:hypothetical protein